MYCRNWQRPGLDLAAWCHQIAKSLLCECHESFNKPLIYKKKKKKDDLSHVKCSVGFQWLEGDAERAVMSGKPQLACSHYDLTLDKQNKLDGRTKKKKVVFQNLTLSFFFMHEIFSPHVTLYNRVPALSVFFFCLNIICVLWPEFCLGLTGSCYLLWPVLNSTLPLEFCDTFQNKAFQPFSHLF